MFSFQIRLTPSSIPSTPPPFYRMKNHFTKSSNIDISKIGKHPEGYAVEEIATVPNYDYIVMAKIFNNENQLVLDEEHFFCFKCRKWLKTSRTFGNIKAHLKNVHNDVFVSRTCLSEQQKAIHARRFILLNGLSFSLIESPDLKAIAPLAGSRKSISCQCTSIAEDIRRKISQISNRSCCCWLVVDEWADSGKQSYLGVHASLLDGNFEFISVCLAHQPLSAIHCDAPYIAGIIAELCSNLLPGTRIIGIVTDTTNLMPAIANCLTVDWSPCFCHVMNLLMQDFVNACDKKLQLLFMIQRSLGSSQVFHNYLVNQKSKLTSLPGYTPTRWYSLFKLMRNFLIMKNNIQAYLHANHNDAIGVPDDSYFEVIKSLLDVFGTARYVMGKMESDVFGSLSCVIDSFRLLNASVNALPPIFEEERNIFHDSFVERWFYYLERFRKALLMASWLNPYQMMNTSLEHEEKLEAAHYIEEELQKHVGSSYNTQNRSTGNRAQHSEANPNGFGITFSVFRNQTHDNNVPEHIRYSKLLDQTELFQNSEQSLYTFWQSNKEIYPNLYKVAMETYIRPASSAMAERTFSKSKKFQGSNRVAMKSNKFVDSMMIIANPQLSASLIQ